MDLHPVTLRRSVTEMWLKNSGAWAGTGLCQSGDITRGFPEQLALLLSLRKGRRN